MDMRKLVFDGLSFSIEAGKKIGICGEAGCGKSTSFLLLPGLAENKHAGL